VSRRTALRASAVFFVVGPCVEAGLGPFLLTGGWSRGDGFTPQALWSVVGALLVLAGLAVVVRAFAGFVVDGRGTPTPAAPAGRLVISGAYRYVRNPMYLATAAMIAGEGLLLARPVLLIAAAAYLATLAAATRIWEEPTLARRFGASYAAYRDAVPGWWPRSRPWTPDR
jgi:protein-S-isoprenylcysteine O-methyltransferase Ste14